jgi:hypothetical protein
MLKQGLLRDQLIYRLFTWRTADIKIISGREGNILLQMWETQNRITKKQLKIENTFFATRLY